jgi:hypothetical protein
MHWRFKLWDIELDPSRAPDTSYSDLLTWFVEIYAEDRGLRGTTWVDHTPENINYAPVLTRLFPEAQFVHIIRDGRAVANSIIPLDWGPNTAIKAAPWWQETVRQGLELESSLPAGRVVRVYYEDLVEAPERTLEWLCEKLALSYEPTMLKADGFRPPGYTSSQHELIGKRPKPERATRWKRTLSDRQVEIFESMAGGLLDRLGYELLRGSLARPPTAAERTAAAVKEFVRGDVVNGIRWLIRSYPLWLSWDFIRVLPDTWTSYQKGEVGDVGGGMNLTTDDA